MNTQLPEENKDENNSPIVDTQNAVEVLPPEVKKGRGGVRPGAGRPPSGRSQNIKHHLYQLIDNAKEAQDIVQAWELIKQIAMDKAINNQDTEDLKWYLNRFFPQARETNEIEIDTTGSQPIITIRMPNTGDDNA
jgi:hypothetical protein